jgi:hypothetical protein
VTVEVLERCLLVCGSSGSGQLGFGTRRSYSRAMPHLVSMSECELPVPPVGAANAGGAQGGSRQGQHGPSPSHAPYLVALGGTSTVVVQEQGRLLSAGTQGRTEAVHETDESGHLALRAMGCLVDLEGERENDERVALLRGAMDEREAREREREREKKARETEAREAAERRERLMEGGEGGEGEEEAAAAAEAETSLGAGESGPKGKEAKSTACSVS